MPCCQLRRSWQAARGTRWGFTQKHAIQLLAHLQLLNFHDRIIISKPNLDSPSPPQFRCTQNLRIPISGRRALALHIARRWSSPRSQKMGKVRRLFAKFQTKASSGSTDSTRTSSMPAAAPGSAAQTAKSSSAAAQPETDPISNTTGTRVQLNAALENLPAEIRREILDALDYGSLRALAHASPIFHQQYRLDRRFLLCGCLQRTLGAVAVDAWAAYRSSPECLADAPALESVAAFLKAYQDRRSSGVCSILKDEALTESDAVAMVAFHFTVIEPLFKRFISVALGHLARETGSPPHHKPLSKTEEARVLRAMFRFQLCCNLFHDRRCQHGGFNFDPSDIVKLFCCLFEPWEVEEVACIHTFARDEFNRIFLDIEWDLNPAHPRFADQRRPPTPTGAFNLDNSGQCSLHFFLPFSPLSGRYPDAYQNKTVDRDGWLGGTLMRGFELLHAVLFQMRDHEHLVTTMQKNMAVGELFGFAMSEGTQWALRNEQRS